MFNHLMSPSNGELLLQILIQPHRGETHGLRIFTDGRYELLSDRKVVLDSTGKAVPVLQEHAWRFAWKFTASELAALKQLIREADFYKQPLQTTPVDDGHMYAWKIAIDGQTYTAETEFVSTIPELEQFYQQLAQIRQLPAQSSIWTVWLEDHYEERLVKGPVNGVAALRPLLQAFLVPTLTAEDSTADFPLQARLDNDQLVVKAVWQEADTITEERALFADGRYEAIKGGTSQPKQPFSPGQVERVLASIQTVDWNQLPNPVEVK